MDDNLGTLLAMIAIAVISAIVTVIRKIDKWIQIHRMGRQAPEGQPPTQSAQPPVPTEQEAREQPSRAAEIQRRLMEELERALGGTEPESPPDAVLPQRPPPPLPQAQPAVAEPPGARERRALEPTGRAGERVTSTGIVIHEAATVRRRHHDHLAVLRDRSDLLRAAVLHEILSPPLALRQDDAPDRTGSP